MCAVAAAGIVLAAGFSRRLGRPKQTVVVSGETLLARTVRIAREAALDPIFVVVQPETIVDDEHLGIPCMLLANGHAEEGIASSIRVGIAAALVLPEMPGAVLMTCDQILTRPEHLRALCAEPEQLTGSGYAGRIATPAYFPRRYFEALLQLRGDTGARALLQDATAVPAEELGFDIDTEEDVERALRFLA